MVLLFQSIVNGFTIVGAVVLSLLFLRVQYKMVHYIAVTICIVGVILLFFADSKGHNSSHGMYIRYMYAWLCFALHINRGWNQVGHLGQPGHILCGSSGSHLLSKLPRSDPCATKLELHYKVQWLMPLQCMSFVSPTHFCNCNCNSFHSNLL